jgi:hypothetical protein
MIYKITLEYNTTIEADSYDDAKEIVACEIIPDLDDLQDHVTIEEVDHE